MKMLGSDKLRLQWNDFEDNVKAAFGEQRGSKEFADVTLACEDGQQVEAHKVILASSSPFFMDILKRNKHPHPLIYMKGTNSEDLMAIVDFVYFGEANIFHENLETFLALAEDLKLRGLEGKPENETNEIINPFAEEKQKTKQVYKKIEIESTKLETKKTNSSNMQVALIKETVTPNLEDLDERIKSMMTRSNVNLDSQGQKATVCTICGKEGQKKVISNHIESNHITGVSHICDHCGHITSTRAALVKHIKSKHE